MKKKLTKAERTEKLVRQLEREPFDPSAILPLLDGPFDTRKVGKSGWVKLARSENYELVRAFLDAGLDPNAIRVLGSPLLNAIHVNDPAMVKLLLEKGADPHVVNEGLGIHIPFEDALLVGSSEIAMALLDTDGLPRWKNERFLFLAAAQGLTPIVERLLSLGIPVDSPGSFDPYHNPLGVSLGIFHTVKKMFLGAFTNTKGPKALVSATPLTVATLCGHESCVHVLLAQGADPRKEDDLGRSALSLAKEKKLSALVRLFEATAISGMGSRRPELLILWSLEGDRHRLKELDWGSIDPNYTDERPAHEGRPILSQAVLAEDMPIATQLLRSGADPNRPDCTDDGHHQNGELNRPDRHRQGYRRAPWRGLTPLHYATLVGNRDLATLLLDHGALVDKGDHVGYTPLSVAAGEGDVSLTKLLLDRGANPHLEFNGGWNATLCGKEHQRIVALFEKHGATSLSELSDGEDEEQEWSGPWKNADPALARRYAKGKVVARLMKRSGSEAFRACVAAVEALLKVRGDEEIETRGGISFTIVSRSSPLVGGAIEEISNRGFRWYREAAPQEATADLVLVPSEDELDAVAAVETSGGNSGIETIDIISWLVSARERWAFMLPVIAGDRLLVRIDAPPNDPEGLAALIYQLSPATVDLDAGNLEALAVELTQEQRFLLYWK